MSNSGDSLQLQSVAVLDDLVAALRTYCRIALESIRRAQGAMTSARQIAEERFEEARCAYERALDDDDGYSYEAEIERDAADRSLAEISATVEALRRQTAELEELCDSHSPRWLRALDDVATKYNAYTRIQLAGASSHAPMGLSFREIVAEIASGSATRADSASSRQDGTNPPPGFSGPVTWNGVPEEDRAVLSRSRTADARAVGQALLRSGTLATLDPSEWSRRRDSRQSTTDVLAYLRSVERVSADAVGRQPCNVVYGSDMRDSDAMYSWRQNTIWLNEERLTPGTNGNRVPPRDTLRRAFVAVIHEGRHAHQRAMSQRPPAVLPGDRHRLPNSILSKFRQNFRSDRYVNWPSPEYYVQPLEEDAFAFEAALQYDRTQDEFLGNHPELAEQGSMNVFDEAVPT